MWKKIFLWDLTYATVKNFQQMKIYGRQEGEGMGGAQLQLQGVIEWARMCLNLHWLNAVVVEEGWMMNACIIKQDIGDVEASPSPIQAGWQLLLLILFQASRFKVAGNLHFSRYFSEDRIHGETSYRRLAQKWSTAEAFWSSRGRTVALHNMSALKVWSHSGRKLLFTGLWHH